MHIPAFSQPLTPNSLSRRHQLGSKFCTSRRGRPSFVCCAAHPRRSVQSQPLELPPSVGFTIEKTSKAKVFLVGCVHGAAASAADATDVIAAAAPDALVLELCNSRLDSLEAMMRKERNGESARQASGKRGRTGQSQEKQNNAPSFRRLRENFGGVGPAIMALGLNAVYGVQRGAGVDPGTEFKAALRAVRSLPRESRVVCGDADARDTIRALTRTVLEPYHALWDAPAVIQFFLRQVLATPEGGINILRVLVDSNGKRVREFVRVFLPLVSATYVGAFLASNCAEALRDRVLFPSTAGSGSQLVQLASSFIQPLLASYIFLVCLSFIYVLIDSRDRVIAQSIKDTAQELARNGSAQPVIVAVVGLLHVNGCLRYVSTGGDVDPRNRSKVAS